MTDAIPGADIKLARIYDGLIATFGNSGPQASGYRSNYSFLRERALVLETVGVNPARSWTLRAVSGWSPCPW